MLKFAEFLDNCKAHPDEKGIETTITQDTKPLSLDCKAHPDEKGIETPVALKNGLAECVYCKAHPDEKGIETSSMWHGP